MNKLSRFTLPGLVVATLIGAAPLRAAADETLAATGAASACGPARVTRLQQRLVDKADQGAPELVRFIHRTRMIYQLDVYEVAKSLDGWRAASRCARADASRDLARPG